LQDGSLRLGVHFLKIEPRNSGRQSGESTGTGNAGSGQHVSNEIKGRGLHMQAAIKRSESDA
jgi:hypothetical protein